MTITDAMVEAAAQAYYAGSGRAVIKDAMRAALEAAYPQLDVIEKNIHAAMAKAEKIRVALEKARRLHQTDCADHNIGLFIDEALSWLSPPPVPDHTGSNKNTDRA